MSKRTSIYMPDDLKSTLASYGEGNSLSGSIAALIKRYTEITSDACPELTLGEWCCICDANNGCGVWLSAGGHDPYQSLWANVADSEEDELGEKWKIDLRSLAERLRGLPLVEKAAVWDVAAKFWAHPKLNEIETIDLLRECGAKIK